MPATPTSMPLPPPRRRDMAQHVAILAAFHLAFGALGLVAAIAILVVFGGIASVLSLGAISDPEAVVAIPILGIVGAVLLLLTLTLSLPGIIGGVGLLKRHPWARILTIVLSVLHLINVPFGTLLALYGLWVLMARDTEALFESPPGGSAATSYGR